MSRFVTGEQNPENSPGITSTTPIPKMPTKFKIKK